MAKKVGYISFSVKIIKLIEYLRPGILDTGLSMESRQDMYGVGLPVALQVSMAPLLLVKSYQLGGSSVNIGPSI